MTEVDDYYQNLQLQAQRSNYAAQDDDPDSAAEALALSGSTGVPATAINDNLEDFQRQHKLALGNKIINDNQYIAEYLNSHPLAASVSHDDLGRLDDLHQSLDNLPHESGLFGWLKQEHTLYNDVNWPKVGSALAAPIGEAFQGWGQFGGGLNAQGQFRRPGDVEFALSHPAAGAILGGVQMGMEAPFRAINALALMGRDGIKSLFGEEAADDFSEALEYFIAKGDLPTLRKGGGLAEARQTPLQAGIRAAARENKLPVPDAEAFTKADLERKADRDRLRIVRDHVERINDMATALQIADPWVSSGKEPPYGLHPLIDKAKDLQAKEDISSFDEAFKKATATATRERSPEIFSNGLRTRLGDRQIGVDPEAVQRLYGDKLPTADDGLLGWDPKLQEKLDAANLTGDRVWLNMADYFGKTDPEVHKQLLDDIAVRSDGPTTNDMKIEAEPKQVIADDPLAQVKGAAGFEPLFSAGDRKITLKRMDEARGKEVFGDQSLEQAEEVHDYDLLDENGKPMGIMSVAPRRGGKDIWVHNIQAGPEASEFYQPRFLGNSLIRDVARQLRAAYPQMERMGGYRVTGAREKANKIDTAWIKFDETPAGWGSVEPMRQLLQGLWEPVGKGVEGRVGSYTLEQQILDRAIQKELERIVPSQANVRTVQELQREKPGDVGGFYQRYRSNWPKIIVALDAPELALGTARHEAIHHLRQYGFINDKEWASLEQAAKDGNWVKKNLGDRYQNLSEEKRLEEAIAEQFRKWAAKQDGAEGHSVFEKIKDFIDQIKVRYKELTGKDLDWQEFFQKIHEGEVGAREGNVPLALESGERPFAGEGLTQFAEREFKAANDADAIAGREKVPTYNAALKQQLIEKYVTKDAIVGDWDHWKKVATDENITTSLTSGPNGVTAAKEHSKGGKTTVIISPYGARTVFHDGVKVVQEQMKDTAAGREAIGEEPSFAEREGFGLYDKGKALGITEAHKQRIEKLLEKQQAEEQVWHQRRNEASLAALTRKEVKARRVELRDQVREDVNQRPDVASDQFMAKYGVKFHPDYLSDEQKARLPKDYIQKKNGVNPDDLAPYFGYTSGDALVERLGMFTEERRRSGMSPRDFTNRLIDVETDRRLNREFQGRKEKDLEDARDQALSNTAMRRISEETLAYAGKAEKAGHKIEAPMSLDDVKVMTKLAFDDIPAGSISRVRLLETASRIGKKIEEAGTQGKWDKVYQLSQQRQHALWFAKYAGEYEKQRAQLDKTAKTMSKLEPPGVRAEFTNWVHDLLIRGGYGINRTIQHLQENIGRKTSKTLEDFVDEKRREYRDPDAVPVADFVLDKDFRKPVDEMTYSEFKDYKTSIDALVKAGRDENKIYVGGEARDRIAFRDEARGDLATFGYKPSKSEPGRITQWPKALFYGITNMETLFNRISRGDPFKPLNRMIMQLAEAANGEARLQREVAAMWEKLPDLDDLDKLVDSPITDPRTRGTPQYGPDGSGTWDKFTRGHVIKMLLNAGNESNWKVLAKGYGADPVALFHWLEKNVTKEDIQFAEAMGDIYKNLIARYDNVREHMTGQTVQKLVLKPIEFNLKDKTTYKSNGWYHPLEADPIRKSVWVQDDAGQWSQMAQGKRDLIGDENYQFTVADGFTKKRTGAIYPLNLDMSQIPHTIAQMIHAINYKEVVKETEKIFSDPLFFEDVAKYYGKNYADGLVPYLAAVAGRRGLPGKNLAQARQASEFMRQNVASTYVGFNLGTIFKHLPTAWVFSMREVGAANYLDALREMYLQAPSVSAAARKFVKDNSEEIQRRDQNWRDTIQGQGREITGAGNWREKIMQAGAAGVSWSDKLSAGPTWLAAYKKAQADGLTHGQSVALGNRAVRRAHGSTAQTNLPPIVRGGGGALEPWMTTFYGFFGTAMQRRIETAHKIADAWDLGVKQGQWTESGKKAGSAFGDFMTYMFWPTLVEELVNGIGTDDHRTWLSRIFSGASMGLASTVPYIRDVMHAAVTGQDPGAGLFTSLLADQNKIIRDVLHPEKAISRQHAAKTVGDVLTAFGEATGRIPKPIANVARYATGLAEGTERPKGPGDVALGLYRGTAKERVEK